MVRARQQPTTEETRHKQQQQQQKLQLTLNAKCWTKTLNATMPLFAWMRRGSLIGSCDLFSVCRSMVSFTATTAWWSVQSPFSVITSLRLLLVHWVFLALFPFDCLPLDIIFGVAIGDDVFDALPPFRWLTSSIVWSVCVENFGEFNPFFSVDGGGGDVDWLVSEIETKFSNYYFYDIRYVARWIIAFCWNRIDRVLHRIVHKVTGISLDRRAEEYFIVCYYISIE